MSEHEVYSPTVLEPHYSAHVNAMTTEGLHTKSDIACQLALRDLCIKHLEKQNRVLGREVDRQAIALKRMAKQTGRQSEQIRHLHTRLRAREKRNG